MDQRKFVRFSELVVNRHSHLHLHAGMGGRRVYFRCVSSMTYAYVCIGWNCIEEADNPHAPITLEPQSREERWELGLTMRIELLCGAPTNEHLSSIGK